MSLAFILRVVLACSSRNDKPNRAFPKSLPEWQHLNLEASVWGLRHYRKDSADTDPTSPLEPKAHAKFSDSEAVGFVFWIEENSELATVRYLGGVKTAARNMDSVWIHKSEKFVPKIREVKPGVVEINTDVSDKNSLQMFRFVLMWLLGHAIFP